MLNQKHATPSNPTSRATVCVVDDNPANVDLLEQELTDAGYRVLKAFDGPQGLEVIERDRPDIVLLDVMMPGLSGYEVCQQLRRREETASLPVILVTAKTGTRDEVVGLDAGANDYVTKPINIETLLARVRTQLRIKRLQDELRASYDNFLRLDKMRQETISMLTHDLKTPLMTVTASTKLLIESTKTNSPMDVRDIASIMLKSSQKMRELIEDFLSLARWDHSGLNIEIEVCDIATIMRETAEIFAPLAHDRGVKVTIDVPDKPLLVMADSILLGRVWQNLLSNAVKYNDDGGYALLSAQPGEDGEVICKAHDNGMGIPADVLPRVFDAFYRSRDRKIIEGSGLGLAVVRAILEGHGSPHAITSEEGVGTEFTFHLRRAEGEEIGNDQ